MYNPATRLLTILEILQAHGQMSGTELARRLEVDKRSIRRYIGMLRDLGIPIEGASGLHGGYRFRPGFKLPPLMLTEDEAAVVALGLMGSRNLGLAIPRETVEAAIAKIQRVLPEAVRARVQALQSTLALDGPTTGAIAGSRWLLDLTEAAANWRCVHIHYRAERGEETYRLISPYGVATRLGSWYAVGHCHLRNDLRIFRLDRILDLEQTDRHFTLPLEFDCLRYLMECMATLPGQWPIEIVLHMSMEEAQQRIRPGYAVLQPTDQGIRLGGQFNDLDSVARYLISLGCRFTIIEPEELRTALRKLGQEMITVANDSALANSSAS